MCSSGVSRNLETSLRQNANYQVLPQTCFGRSGPPFPSIQTGTQVYKFKFDLQPGSLTDQVVGEHQPSKKHP